MSVRSRLAAAPWPVWSGVGLLYWIAWGWPFVLIRPAYWINVVIWGVAGFPLSIAVARWRNRKRTGLSDDRQRELLRAARQGTPPADQADRRRLRGLVAEWVGESRQLRWIGPILGALLTGALLAVVLVQDRSVAWLVAGAVWYAGLAAVAWTLTQRRLTEQEQMLALLGPAEDTDSVS